MRILLIGGSGIISSEICKNLLDNGNEVTIFNRGKRKAQIDSRAKLVIGDIRKETIDTIQNKIASQYEVIVDFISYDVEQIKKTIAISNGRCKQFIFVSSATVYKETGLPYTEDSMIGNSEWDYSLQKTLCERYLAEQTDLDFEYTIIRPYVTYSVTRIPYQFAPLEYYTIINRIKDERPIPIYGERIKCTVTYSKEFAVGAVGLMLNQKAYGQAFHITCSHVTTWEDIINTVAAYYDKKPILVKIPKETLLKHRTDAGFSIDEILGDKGRDMLFDNLKIKNAVPQFKGEIRFEQGIIEVLNNFENNPSLQIVNFGWDGNVDRIISQCTKDKEILGTLNLKAYKNICPGNIEEKIYKKNRSIIYNRIKHLLNK